MTNLIIGLVLIIWSLYYTYDSTKAPTAGQFMLRFLASFVGIMAGIGTASGAIFFVYASIAIFGIAYICFGILLIMVRRYLFGAFMLVVAGVMAYFMFV